MKISTESVVPSRFYSAASSGHGLVRARHDETLMESDPTPPHLQKSGIAVAGAIVGIILVGLAMIAMVMTVFWKCRVARWKRLERQRHPEGGDAMLSPVVYDSKGVGAQQKPLPTVPSSEILASVPNAHDAGPERGANHYYA
ncbi:hypothetical protein PG996_006059 [Apiospora saccharicola]|uniref:Uncharacterized protein n=1 Tax=Apiospora saccharicola TaxID=335842 RepID=A0ABR1VQY7_9PEZI